MAKAGDPLRFRVADPVSSYMFVWQSHLLSPFVASLSGAVIAGPPSFPLRRWKQSKTYAHARARALRACSGARPERGLSIMSALVATEELPFHVLVNRGAVDSYRLTDLRCFDLSSAYQLCQCGSAQPRVMLCVGKPEPLWRHCLRRSCVHPSLLRVFVRLHVI